MFQLRLIVVSLLVLSVFLSCSKMDSSTLAVVDGESLALDDFTATNPASRFADKSNDDIDMVVDDFVKKEVFTRAALKRGYEEDSLVVTKLKNTQRGSMMQYVFEKAILGAILDDEYLKEIYDKTGAEVKARHILIQFKGVARAQASRSKAEAQSLVDDIKARIDAGESFEALAAEFSEGPSKSKGGDLGWFGWGQMVDPFQQVAFSMKPGGVSGAVETQFGLHLIKVEDRRDLDRGSFEEEKPRLMQQARRSKEAEIRQYADEFIANIKNEAGFQLNQRNIKSFFDIYSGSSFQGKPLDVALRGLNYQPPLLSLNGEEKGSGWIIAQLNAIPPHQRPSFSSENHLVSILDQLAFQELVVKHGFAQKYDADDAYKSKIDDVKANLVYSAFLEKEVNAMAEPSDVDLMKFYEKYKTEKYMDRTKVHVKEVFVKDSLLAVDLKKRLNAGEDIAFLAGRYSERRTGKENQGDLPPFQEGRYGAMGKQAFMMLPGEISDPIKLGNGYSIIRLEEKIEEQPRPFTQVKSRIRNELVNELRKERSDKLFDELKKEFSVKINYDAVHDFYAQEEEAATS